MHFAIALAYYGLLRIPTTKAKAADVDLREQLALPTFLVLCADLTQTMAVTVEASISSYDAPRLNFARLIHRYTRAFAQTDTAEALNYLYLVCLNADVDESQVQLCHDYIRELVMETRKYSTLLGDIRNDGTKIVSSESARSCSRS